MGSMQKNNDQRHTMLNPFVSIQKEFDKALHGFYDMFAAKPFHLPDFDNLTLAPLMDLVEEESCYKLEVEMPGMDEKDIHLSVDDNLLTIRGDKSFAEKKEHKHYIAREISYGHYERSLTLPLSADGDKASACFKKGILCITIPKKAKSGARKHEIAIKKS